MILVMRLEEPQWKRFGKILLLFSHLHTKSSNTICIVNKLVRKHEITLQFHIKTLVETLTVLLHQIFHSIGPNHCEAEHADIFCNFSFFDWSLKMCLSSVSFLQIIRIQLVWNVKRDLFSIHLPIWQIPRKRSTFSSSREV